MKAPLRFWPTAALGVFLVALLLRVGYVLEIRDVGFFNSPLSDALVYDQRARGIAEGDWLGPEDFVHAPLYAYALAAVRLAGFDSLLMPRLLQALLGALACVLLMDVTRRLLRDINHQHTIAITAGLLLAIYPPAIFFDGLIQKTSMVLALSTLVLWLMMLAAHSAQRRWWIAIGIALGLLILVRQNALALIPLIMAWAWLGQRTLARTYRAQCIAVMLMALVITLSPWAIRNKIVIDNFVLTTPNMGQNFAMGNHPHATGTYLPAQRGRASGDTEQAVWKREAETALGRELSAAEISDYFMRASLAYIRENPSQWIALSWKKWLMTWGAYELPDTEDYYLYKEHSIILRAGDWLLHFGVLGPLAIGGIVLTARHWRRLWVLYSWLAINALAIAVFVVFARYRAPMLPLIMLFAAIMLIHGWYLLRQGAWRSLIPAMLSIILAGIAMNWPIHAPRKPQAFSYVNHAVALANVGEFQRALAELDKAAARSPHDVDTHWVRGSVLFDLQQYELALQQYQLAVQGDPSSGIAHRGVGSSLLAMGQPMQAAEHFVRALELDPLDHIAMNKLAVCRASAGHLLEALALLQAARAIGEQDAEVALNLGNVHVALGELDAAAEAYRQAMDLRSNYVDAMLNLASVELARQNTESALELLANVLDQQPANIAALVPYVNTLMQQQRRTEAIAAVERAIDHAEPDDMLLQLRRALLDD
jgi:tetratricopeptide (TPR) repeat protein